MKKLFAGLFSAALLTGSAVGLTSTTATAAPYPGTIDTSCHGNALNNPRVGRTAHVAFRVTTGGNGGAAGWVTFKYVREGNGVVVRETQRWYDGPGWDDYRIGGLPRGHYNVRVHFNSAPADSVYQNCRTSFDQDVRRRR